MEQVRFTCNLCGEVSTKAVSPHAWASGSVFARCDGCRVIHKLVGARASMQLWPQACELGGGCSTRFADILLPAQTT